MNLAVALYVAHLTGTHIGPGQLAAGVATAAITTMGSVSLPGTVSFFASVAPVAAAMGVPVVALFGSTDPAVCGPRGTASTTVVYEKVECSPCYLKECPVKGHPCLDQFAPERVHEVVRRHLR